MNKLNYLVGMSQSKLLMKKNIHLNKKGISTLVEVAGVLAIIVAAIMMVMPQATTAVFDIWTKVTGNAKNFFNSSTGG